MNPADDTMIVQTKETSAAVREIARYVGRAAEHRWERDKEVLTVV